MNTNLGNTEEWLIKAVKTLPKEYGTVLAFDALTGLRPSEACNSCTLITELNEKGRLNDYLDREQSLLQHFIFKQLFLRKSKNAYISFITPQLLEVVLKYKPKVRYMTLDKALNYRGLETHFSQLRKMYATNLRKGLPSEIIDLLQGRIGESIFVKFYYRPYLEQVRDIVFKTIEPVQDELLSILA